MNLSPFPKIGDKLILVEKKNIRYIHAYRADDPKKRRELYASLAKDLNFGPLTLSIFFRLVANCSAISHSDLQALFKDKIQWEIHQAVSTTSRRDYDEDEIRNLTRYARIPGLDSAFLAINVGPSTGVKFYELRCSHATTFEIFVRYLHTGFYKDKYCFTTYRTAKDVLSDKPLQGSSVSTTEFCDDAFLKFCSHGELLTVKTSSYPVPIFYNGLLPKFESLLDVSQQDEQSANLLIHCPIPSVLSNTQVNTTVTTTTTTTSSSSSSTTTNARNWLGEAGVFLAYSEYQIAVRERSRKDPKDGSKGRRQKVYGLDAPTPATNPKKRQRSSESSPSSFGSVGDKESEDGEQAPRTRMKMDEKDGKLKLVTINPPQRITQFFASSIEQSSNNASNASTNSNEKTN